MSPVLVRKGSGADLGCDDVVARAVESDVNLSERFKIVAQQDTMARRTLGKVITS